MTWFAGALALLAGPAVQAVDASWPDAAIPECNGGANGSLQRCIDYHLVGSGTGGYTTLRITDSASSPGLRVINENITVNLPLNASFALMPHVGVDAVFANDRSLTINTHSEGVTPEIAVIGLVFNRGNLSIEHRANGTSAPLPPDGSSPASSITITGNRFNGVLNSSCGIQITTEQHSANTIVKVNGNIVESDLGGAADRGGICFRGGQQGAQGIEIVGNRVESHSGDFAVGIDIGRNASEGYPLHYSIQGVLRISRNQLMGGEGTGNGIRVAQVPSAGQVLVQIDNNMVTGWRSAPETSNAGISLALSNAPALGGRHGIGIYNNTVVASDYGIWVEPVNNSPEHGVYSLQLMNNLISNNAIKGIQIISASTTTVTGTNNLLSGNGSNAVPPTLAHTIGDNPRLLSLAYPRPSENSPVRNQGASLPDFVSLGDFDVDGERRLINGVLDIGAYEISSDRAGQLVAAGNEGYGTEITNLGTLLNNDAIVATPILESLSTTGLNQPVIGVRAIASNPNGTTNFRLFNENETTPIIQGQRFSVLSPGSGKDWFVHPSSATGVLSESPLSHPALLPHAVAVALHRWDDPAGGASSGSSHNHPIGLGLSESRHWYLSNESFPAVPMVDGHIFNVVVAPPGSPNAFYRVFGNTAVSHIRLDHPLLNDNPCAAPIVGYMYWAGGPSMGYAGSSLAIAYQEGFQGAPGHWYAVAASPNPVQTGANQFRPGQGLSVIIDGAQANSCKAMQGILFANGFE